MNESKELMRYIVSEVLKILVGEVSATGGANTGGGDPNVVTPGEGYVTPKAFRRKKPKQESIKEDDEHDIGSLGTKSPSPGQVPTGYSGDIERIKKNLNIKPQDKVISTKRGGRNNPYALAHWMAKKGIAPKHEPIAAHEPTEKLPGELDRASTIDREARLRAQAAASGRLDPATGKLRRGRPKKAVPQMPTGTPNENTMTSKDYDTPSGERLTPDEAERNKAGSMLLKNLVKKNETAKVKYKTKGDGSPVIIINPPEKTDEERVSFGVKPSGENGVIGGGSMQGGMKTKLDTLNGRKVDELSPDLLTRAAQARGRQGKTASHLITRMEKNPKNPAPSTERGAGRDDVYKGFYRKSDALRAHRDRKPNIYNKNEVAPEGWEKTVKAMKKHKNIDNPWALANYMKNKGDTPHK